jgi:hypothetical protein
MTVEARDEHDAAAATQFIARRRDRLPTILDTLEALGRARRVAGADGTRWSAG